MLNIHNFTRLPLCLLILCFWSFSGQVLAQTGPPIELDVLGTCLPANTSGGGSASTKFFVQYNQMPDSVYWLFEIDQTTQDSLSSRQLQPIHTFSEEGSYPVQLFAVYGQDTSEYTFTVDISQSQDELQLQDDEGEPVSGEVVLCPGDTKTLESLIASGGSEPSSTPVNWFRPQSADDPNPVLNQSSITIGTEQNDEGKYKDVGTYYVVYDDGNGCTLYQSFRVVVYNEEDQNGSIWYFGEGAGIDFRGGAGVPIQSTALVGGNSAPQGNAIVGDPNADILFLTNGESLWFGNDEEPATNGTALGGSREVTQNSLFVPFSSDETMYYLFTINEQGQFSFSALDLKVTPIPGVAVSEAGDNVNQPLRAIPLLESVTEKLTSTGRTDGGSWVVVHELNSDAFMSYPVSFEGVGTPVRSEVGSFHTEGSGYMRFSENGEILATTVNTGGSNYIELFRFNADTGTVEEPLQLPIEESGEVYGLEFAGDRLYATVRNAGGPSYLYQYTVDSTYDHTSILESRVMVEAESEDLGALQVGPDGQLYIARNGSGMLYQHGSPTDSITADTFVWQDFDLEGGTSTLGLPNFGENAGSSVPEATVSAADVCIGSADSLRLSGTQRYSNDQMLFFEITNESGTVVTTESAQAEGQGGSVAVAPDVYESWGPGTYTVNLSIQNECGLYPLESLGQEPVTTTFTISPRPITSVADQTLELCDDQSVTFSASATLEGQEVNPSEAVFVWLDAISNAVVASGPEYTVSEPGAWLVYSIASNGCPSDTLNVEAIDLRPDADLGEDFGVCQGEELPQQELSIDITNPNDFNYAWFLSINGSTRQNLENNSTRQSLQDVDTQLPGTYEYVVEITQPDNPNGCFRADTVEIIVAAEPLVSIMATDNNCNGFATISAEVQGANGDISYQWFGPGIISGQGSNQIRIDQDGEYYVEIEDALTGCTSRSQVLDMNLQNPLQSLQLEAEAACAPEGTYEPNTINLITSYGGSVTIEWFELTNIGEYQAIDAYRNQRQIQVDDGSYRAVVTLNNPNCESQSEMAEITVNRTVLPQNVLQPVYTLCPTIPEMQRDTLSVPGYNEYEWINTTTGQVLSRTSQLIITTAGDYELRVDNCDEPTRFRVVMDCTPRLHLPNVIRIPSNNPNNSVFSILNQHMLDNIEQFQILILNRWGEVIYQSNDPAFEWRGTDRNGELVMVNTYVYVITYQNRHGEDQQIQRQRGGITVLR